MKTNGIVVINLHGILIDEQWEIYKRIQRNWSTYCGYMNFPKFITHQDFLNRWHYNVCHELMTKNYSSKAKYIYGIYKTQAAIVNSILEDDNFYYSCELLNFAKKCILKPSFIESAKIHRVIILIDKYSTKQAENALHFCEEMFDHPKISFLVVDAKTKVKTLTTSLRAFTLYLDHNVETVRSVVEKLPNLESVEFLIPRYKFNSMPIELSMLIHGKQGAFTYYSEAEEAISSAKNIL